MSFLTKANLKFILTLIVITSFSIRVRSQTTTYNISQELETAGNGVIVRRLGTPGVTFTILAYYRSLRDFGYLDPCKGNAKLHAFYWSSSTRTWKGPVSVNDLLIPVAGDMYAPEILQGFEAVNANGNAIELNDVRDESVTPGVYFQLSTSPQPNLPNYTPPESYPFGGNPFPLTLSEDDRNAVNNGLRVVVGEDPNLRQKASRYYRIDYCLNDNTMFRCDGIIYRVLYLLRPVVPKGLVNPSQYQNMTWVVGFPFGGGVLRTLPLGSGTIIPGF